MQARRGFTLVEMLVAMTLTIFLMIILSECFVASLESFRQLKALGDMEANLRTAATLLRRDLSADHFEGKRRLSDAGFWQQGPPREGFFHIYQGSTPVPAPGPGYYVCEDPSRVRGAGLPLWPAPLDTGVFSYRAVDHILHFSVKLRGNKPSEVFSTSLNVPSSTGAQTLVESPLFNFGQPDNRFQPPHKPLDPQSPRTFNSPWAEVAYFLFPSGLNANGVPLYSLYRRQRLAVPNSDIINWSAVPVGPPAMYQQVSAWLASTGRLYFNSPSDLTIPERRFANSNPQTVPTNVAGAVVPTWLHYFPLVDPGYIPGRIPPMDVLPHETGDDLVLTNVVSFEVKVLFVGGGQAANSTTFLDLYGSQDTTQIVPAIINYSYNWPTYKNGTDPSRTLDTWSSLRDDTPSAAFPQGVNYSIWNLPPAQITPALLGHCPPMRWGSSQVQTSLAAISVTLRVYDLRTEQTRQITIIQDL
jgi:prepilin-type N-terminal cleavage/methylation domain-containing protein